MPVPDSKILLVDQDLVAGQVLTEVLNSVGYSVTLITEPATALPRVKDHQLVILDVVTGGRTAADICREIRATPGLAAIPVVCISQSDDVGDRIRFLEVGADDVIAKPFDARELEARVEALLLRFQRSRGMTPVEAAALPPRVAHRLVTAFSPKGGVGTTTIAVNIAVAVAARNPERTLLIDLDRQFGQVATHLNLQVRQTMADLVRDTGAIKEPELLRTYATHSQGLHVLL
ncbi:MAG TPA: response regulator, partial [Candidatus Acidoferrum sp.]|nr:response regulator [Candidatus Acidoferrum sp.]